MATPADLAGKTVWLRAEDAVGADGALVTAWPDQSGLGHDAGQFTQSRVALGQTPSGGPVVRLTTGSISLPYPLHPASTTQALCSSQVNPGYRYDFLVDGVIDSGQLGWASKSAPSVAAPEWARLQPATPKVVTQYRVYRQPNASLNRAPKDFTFEGSMDGETGWTVLDTRAGVTWVSADSSKGFTFANATAYTFYRLNFTATQGGGDILHLAEITLNEEQNANAASPGEMWLVVKATTTSGSSRSWALGRGSGGNYYPYSDGKIYDDFLNATRRSFTPTVDVFGWRLVRITLDAAGSLTYRLDEAVQATYSGVAAAWPTSPTLATGATLDIAEALILTQPASAAEVAGLITYFNQKHGLAVPGGSAPSGTPQLLTGAPAALTVTAPSGAVDARTAGPVALTGTAASLTVSAPAGDVTTLAHGEPVALVGTAVALKVTTAPGSFVVSNDRPAVLEGTPAALHVSAPVGKVVARQIPLVIDTIRLTGVMGETTNLAFAPEPGDVIIIVRSLIHSRVGTGEVAYKIASVTGLGATWTIQHKSESSVDTSWAVGVVGPNPPGGSAVVTFDDPYYKDQLVVGYLIRGVDGAHTAVASMRDTGASWNASPGQIVIGAVFDETGWYPSVFKAPGVDSRPSAAAWTAVAPYRTTNEQPEVIQPASVGYAVPRVYQDWTGNPVYSLGGRSTNDPNAPQTITTNFGMVLGTAVPEPEPVALEGAPVEYSVSAAKGAVAAEVVFGRAGLRLGSTLTVEPISFVKLPPMSAGMAVASSVSEGDEVLVEVADAMECGLGVASRIVQRRDWGADPRTGRPGYKVRVVTRDGTGVVELDKATIGALATGVNQVDQWSFRVPRANKKAKRVLPIAHEAQLWRGNILLTRGPIGPGRPDGAWITYDVRRPDWLLRDRRVIGRIPKQQILRNPGFTQGGNGLAYWTGAYDSQSALKAPPQMHAVDDDYAIPGTRALEMGAVDKVVVKKVDIESPAVFVPNQATYLKGGEDKVKAVGEDIPEGSVVRITGFTANDGTGDGLQLSLKRAQAAKATLDAMGKKFVFKLPTKLRSPNANDGTVAGRGYYEPVASNSTEKGRRKNRRVSIAYEGTQTATGHQQYVRQTLTVRNTGQVPATYTLAGDMRILRWDGAPKDGWAMRLMLLDIVATKETVETSAVFAPNSAAYLDGGEDKIKKIGEKIPEGAVINLVGHTADNRRNGDPGDGLDLSLARAKAARATLAGMDRKFTFKLPDLTKIPARQRKDDGQVVGRGYYDPVASNATDAGQAKNRRVEIYYTAKTVVEEGAESSATMNELTPRVEWEHYETSVDVPNDGKSRTLEVRLYPPAGASRWTNVGLYPNEQLGFYRVDQALIVKGLVEHAQDEGMGHGDLGIKTRTPLTGMPRTKEYPFHGTPLPVGTALDWFTSIFRGLDIDCEVTPEQATIVTHYPRQGTSADVTLVHGGRRSNVVGYKPLQTSVRDLASSIIMQSDEPGSFRPEAYARDAKALGGTLLEAVISAESETPPAELAEGARVALDQSLHPRPGWEVTLDPSQTTRVLDEIGKGDLVRTVLPDEGVDRALRMVQRSLDPVTDTVTLTLVEV